MTFRQALGLAAMSGLFVWFVEHVPFLVALGRGDWRGIVGSLMLLALIAGIGWFIGWERCRD